MTVKAPALVRGETNLDRIVTTINLLQANGADADSVSSLNTSVSNNTGSIVALASSVSSLYSGQIPFPASQNPSSNSNTLDDYEEVDFTPRILFGGSSTGITTSIADGAATKIGNFVSANISILLSAKGSSATGDVTIANLPYAANSTSNRRAVAFCYLSSVSSAVSGAPFGIVAENTSTVTLQYLSSGSGNAVTDAHLTDSTRVHLVLNYRV